MEAGQGHALVGGHVHLELDARHLGQALEHLQALLAVHGTSSRCSRSIDPSMDAWGAPASPRPGEMGMLWAEYLRATIELLLVPPEFRNHAAPLPLPRQEG